MTFKRVSSLFVALTLFEQARVSSASDSGSTFDVEKWDSTESHSVDFTTPGWYGCSDGYAITGFYQAQCTDYIDCLTSVFCARPYSTASWANCVIQSVNLFSNGDKNCPSGKFITNIYSDKDGNNGKLKRWTKFKCCEFDGFGASSSDTSQDWTRMGSSGNKGKDTTVPEGQYMTGVYKKDCDQINCWDATYTRATTDFCRVTSTVVSGVSVATANLDYFVAVPNVNEFFTAEVSYPTPEKTEEITTTTTFSKTTGTERTVSVESTTSGGAYGVESEVSVGFEATASEEYTEETSWSKTTSTTFPATTLTCQPRHTCERKIYYFEIDPTPLDITVTMLCDAIGEQVIEGTVTPSGGELIQSVNTQVPIDCVYYTSDYYAQRGNGSLPHCWTCDVAVPDVCTACTDSKVEMDDNFCYNSDVCLECGGTVRYDIPDNTYVGAFCFGENITTTACQAKLAAGAKQNTHGQAVEDSIGDDGVKGEHVRVHVQDENDNENGNKNGDGLNDYYLVIWFVCGLCASVLVFSGYTWATNGTNACCGAARKRPYVHVNRSDTDSRSEAAADETI